VNQRQAGYDESFFCSRIARRLRAAPKIALCMPVLLKITGFGLLVFMHAAILRENEKARSRSFGP
jgi:hypothetical protein